jgi:replication-associated recombination protein RarA
MGLATIHGMNAFACVSAMQKCIRRGMEREAMEFAVELGHTSRNLASMVCTRLQIISHEDIGLADPFVQVYVATACQQAMAWYSTEKPGKWRMPVGNAIRLMARAAKSREGDTFNIAIGLRSLLDGFAPEIPDYAIDMHTHEGRRRGRGIDHFLTEGTKLVPEPTEPDIYADEAAMYMRRKLAGEQPKTSMSKSAKVDRTVRRVDPHEPHEPHDRMLWDDNEGSEE